MNFNPRILKACRWVLIFILQTLTPISKGLSQRSRKISVDGEKSPVLSGGTLVEGAGENDD